MATEPKPGLIEGQTLTSDQDLSCDVCIIGTGAGGGFSAKVLQEAGLKVLMLEAGGYFTKARFNMREGDSFRNLYQEGGLLTTKDGGIAILQGGCVGGGTVVNWVSCFRTPEWVFEDHWRKKWGMNGFTYKELEPHFDAISQRLNINPVSPEEVNKNNQIIKQGGEALGYEIEYVPRNVRECKSLGFCDTACPIDANQSQAITTIPDAMRAGATVISRCYVDKVVVEKGVATGVEAHLRNASGRHPTGHKVNVKAKYVIVSAGGRNSPALLMRSDIPDPEDRIGARTFLQPQTVVAAEMNEPVNSWYGIPQAVACKKYQQRGDKVGYTVESAMIHPVSGATSAPLYGLAHQDFMKDLANVATALCVVGDGLQDHSPGGQVKLDGYGRGVVDYTISDSMWEGIMDSHRAMGEIFFAGGAKQVYTTHDPPLIMTKKAELNKLADMPWQPSKVIMFSAHQLGGCMASSNRKYGVIRPDDFGHYHVKNLHVIDGTFFPTGIAINPSVSIYAAAHLIAGRLASKWT